MGQLPILECGYCTFILLHIVELMIVYKSSEHTQLATKNHWLKTVTTSVLVRATSQRESRDSELLVEQTRSSLDLFSLWRGFCERPPCPHQLHLCPPSLGSAALSVCVCVCV